MDKTITATPKTEVVSSYGASNAQRPPALGIRLARIGGNSVPERTLRVRGSRLKEQKTTVAVLLFEVLPLLSPYTPGGASKFDKCGCPA
jgi:hypothetical protein